MKNNPLKNKLEQPISKETEQLINELNKSKIDTQNTSQYKQSEYYLKYDNTAIFTAENFSCITGQSGSGKTTFTAFLIAQIINNDIGFPIEDEEKTKGFHTDDKQVKKILWFDTEQSKYHLSKAINIINHTTGADISNKIDFFAVKEFNSKKRLEMFKYLAYCGTYDFIVLDGVRDIITTINNEEIATQTIDLFMNIVATTKGHIVNILHENKSKGNEQNNMRGHIGTELMNKAESVITVQYDKNSKKFAAICTKSRDVFFKDIEFKRSGDGGKVVELANDFGKTENTTTKTL